MKKPANLPLAVQRWDNLHILSRELLLSWAGLRFHLATRKWAELDTWIQELIADGVARKMGGARP